MNFKNKKLIASMSFLAMVFSTGCAQNNSENHQIAIQFGSYTTAKSKILNFFIPDANAAVSSLNMCFKRLRFKTADDPSVTSDPSSDNDNIDFNLGSVDISSGATSLGTISLPEGNYTRIEFDLENSCASGKSLSLVNGNGSFSSTERITIKFEGNFTANADGVLTLGVQQILNSLNSYNGGSSLKVTAEGISGVLSN